MTTTTLMTTTGTAAAAAAAAPQPSRYIVGPPSAAPATSAPALLPAIKGGAGPARTSAPRIIYAPDLPRPSNDAIIYDASPRASHGSLRSRPSQRGHHSRHGSRGAEDVVLFERSRSRVALGPAEDDLGRRRSRSITYETNPRLSGRVVERQRVVVEEEDGRRREYYSKNAGS
ncbi:MAG: hypothetical protein M1818_001215 [Claussenomyces sp. TS43310]|nr:MAG: hypothetical protein M1818_001215 [Claussenomyces sp. TS43310]